MSLKSYQVVILALAIVMFPRLVAAVGAPKFVNFLHFAFVPVVFALVSPKIQPYGLKLLWITLALLGAMTLSALVNGSGVINVALDFLLLAEPFLLLMAIVGIPWSHASVKRFRFWMLLFAFVNVGLAYYQWFVVGQRNDDVKGVFTDMGAGHHVAGALALSAAVYFLVDSPVQSRLLRAAIFASFIPVVWFTDAKQVIVVFLFSLLILTLYNLPKLRKLIGFVKTFGYLAVVATSIIVLRELASTVFPALAIWVDTNLIGEGLARKFAVFSMMAQYYTTPLNWLVGLGPGHTVGRLGQMLPDYAGYLRPLGASMSPVTDIVFQAQQDNWITNSETGSSMWSPMFSWAGIWGDLGLLGFGAYLYLWFVLLRRFCLDDLSRFLFITIVTFGVVFGWMEEPGYVLFVVALIGLRWQEHQSRERIVYQKRLRERLSAGSYDGAFEHARSLPRDSFGREH